MMCYHRSIDFTITGMDIVLYVLGFIGIFILAYMLVATASYFDGKVTKPPWIWWRKD